MAEVFGRAAAVCELSLSPSDEIQGVWFPQAGALAIIRSRSAFRLATGSPGSGTEISCRSARHPNAVDARGRVELRGTSFPCLALVLRARDRQINAPSNKAAESKAWRRGWESIGRFCHVRDAMSMRNGRVQSTRQILSTDKHFDKQPENPEWRPRPGQPQRGS